MKEIKLSGIRGEGKVALVDDEDFSYLSQFKWFAQYDEHTESYYAHRNEGKIPNRHTVYMAREIMSTPRGMLCDHINHDTLDNRKKNLRNVNGSQNSMNKKIQKNNSLGVRNVIKYRNGYRVDIRRNGSNVFCGYFDSLEVAIQERDKKIAELHGEFAYTGESR